MTKLNDPFILKGRKIKNRFFRSATGENMATSLGHVTDQLLNLYYNLAEGGTGLIVTGITTVDPSGKTLVNQTGVWDDEHIPGLKKLANVIHEYGGEGTFCTVQLHHSSMGNYGFSNGVQKDFTLRDLSEEKIKSTINQFALAAGRLKKAGFDGVAVHGAHGYLISAFVTPAINNRTDRWGGSLENRMRFPIEIYSAVRKEVGDDFPILWKMNTSDFDENGQGIEDYLKLAKKLSEVGVDLIEMSGGLKDQTKLRAKLKKEAGPREAYFRDAIPRFREAVGDRTALVHTGGLRSLEIMEEVLNEGVDFIGLSRPLIAEPDLPNRLLYSPDKRPAKCTSCLKCLAHITTQPLKCVEFDPLRAILHRASPLKQTLQSNLGNDG